MAPAVKSVWSKQGAPCAPTFGLFELSGVASYIVVMFLLEMLLFVWFNMIPVLTRRDVLVQIVVNQVVIIMKTCFLRSFWKEEAHLDRAVVKILVSPNVSRY